MPLEVEEEEPPSQAVPERITKTSRSLEVNPGFVSARLGWTERRRLGQAALKAQARPSLVSSEAPLLRETLRDPHPLLLAEGRQVGSSRSEAALSL